MAVRAGIIAVLVLLAGNGAVVAQAVLEEVVVTATKREATLRDLPVAVTVTPGDRLEQAQILDLLDLQSIVPSLRATQLQTSTQTNFLIRGFGNGANNPGIESSVGVFVDGVYRSRSASRIGDLLDIERIEVLRGPQSTLFGQNASAGVVSIITRLPDPELNATVDVTIGDYDARLVRGRLSGPAGDRTSFSLTGSIHRRRGYFDERSSGTAINDRNRWDLRGQWLIDPNDDLSIRVIADAGRIDEACCGVVNVLNGPTGAVIGAVGGRIYTGDPFDRQGYLDRRPVNLVDDDGLSVHLDWRPGNVVVESISAIRHQQVEVSYDADFTSADLVANDTNRQAIATVTQEVRFGGSGEGSLGWLLGGYFVTEDVKYDSRILYGDAMRAYVTALVAAQTDDSASLDTLEALTGVPTGTFFGPGQGSIVDAHQDMDSYTLFGQADWTLGDRMTFTLGLAYTDNAKDVELAERTTDVFSSLDLVDIGFTSAFAGLTGGLSPTPENLAANPVVAATADSISVTPCPVSDPPPRCNAALALYRLQFLPPVVPFAAGSADTATTHTVRLAYDVGNSMTLYGGVSTGFKATSWNLSRDSKPAAPAEPDRSPLGGFANPYYGRYGTRLAAPEASTVYEAGFRGRWDYAAVDLTLFDQAIEGFQSNVFTGTGFNLANAGKQSTEGLEVEVLVRPGDRWEVLLSGLFMDPVYDSYVGAEGPDGPTDLSGTAPAGLHDRSVTVSVRHDWTAGRYEGFVRADYLHESRVQLVETVPAVIASRAVNTLNASAGIALGPWELRLWGRNLTDDDYFISAFPSVAQTGSVSGYTNAPRTLGLSLRRDF